MKLWACEKYKTSALLIPMWFWANFKMQVPSANYSSLTRGNRIHPIGALTSEMGYVLLLVGIVAKNIIV